MKKKLQEQLILLAQRILEEEKTSNATSMKNLAAELLQKLTVLEYLENQLEEIPAYESKESLDSKSFREENWFTEPEPVPQPDHKEDLVQPLMEKIKDLVAQMPEETERFVERKDFVAQMPEETYNFEEEEDHSSQIEEETETVDEIMEEVLPEISVEEIKVPPTTEKYKRNDLEEFAARFQRMPEFERKDPELFPPSNEGRVASKNYTESRQRSLNDTANKGLNIGLNDRLAFIKHLFEGQAEDYTRVLSQINTMENYDAAKKFINGNIKPDYNNWSNKEEYSNRFMYLVEKSFN